MNNVEINGHSTSVIENDDLKEKINDPAAADENDTINKEMDDRFVADEDNGLQEFVSKLILSEERAEIVIKLIVTDLKNAFKLKFPYEIVPFGSYVNGLCCLDSDVDISISVAPFVQSPRKHAPTMNKIKNNLYGSKSFTNLIHVRKAKVPLLKFKHMSTMVDCDLSLDNEIGVSNTYLVKSYISMHSSLKTVVLVLKQLLVMNDIKGTGKITTYILFWMVVFYMQQLDLLPAVSHARKTSPTPRTILGWNCSTPPILDKPVNDSYSIRSHIEQFCEFYDSFDLATMAVCPYLACPIVAENLTNLNVPVDLFSSYFDKASSVYPFATHIMNVHDPTYLNSNLTRPVTQQTVDVFKALCRNTCEFLRKNPKIPLHELLAKNDPRLRVTLSIPAIPAPVVAPPVVTNEKLGPSKAKRRRMNKK